MQSERLTSKGARTLYYENILILITIEGVEHVSINDRLFDFSYERQRKNFRGSSAMRTKFAELYQSEKRNLLNFINQKKKRTKHK